MNHIAIVIMIGLNALNDVVVNFGAKNFFDYVHVLWCNEAQ